MDIAELHLPAKSGFIRLRMWDGGTPPPFINRRSDTNLQWIKKKSQIICTVFFFFWELSFEEWSQYLDKPGCLSLLWSAMHSRIQGCIRITEGILVLATPACRYPTLVSDMSREGGKNLGLAKASQRIRTCSDWFSLFPRWQNSLHKPFCLLKY